MTNGYPPSGGQPPPEGPPGQGAPPPAHPQYPQQGQGGYPQHPPQQGGYGQYPQGPHQAGPTRPRAGFWQRVGAYLLDVVILLVPILIIMGLLGAFDAENFDDRGRVTGGPLEGGNYFLLQLFSLVLSLAYFTLLEGSRSGQTIGKKALGIRVIGRATGGSIGNGKALLRNVWRSIPTLVPIIGFVWALLDPLWMLWDTEKQTLHDKAASTLVVPVAAYPIEPGYAQQQAYGRQQGYPPQEGYGPPQGGPPPGYDPKP